MNRIRKIWLLAALCTTGALAGSWARADDVRPEGPRVDAALDSTQGAQALCKNGVCRAGMFKWCCAGPPPAPR